MSAEQKKMQIEARFMTKHASHPALFFVCTDSVASHATPHTSQTTGDDAVQGRAVCKVTGFLSRSTVSRGYCSQRNGKPISSPSGFAGPPRYRIVPVPLPNGAAGTEQTQAAGASVALRYAV